QFAKVFPMDLELTDKVAIVTGSSKGLGLAIAKALIAEGCRVTVCARGEEQLNQSAADLRKLAGRKDRVVSVAADLSTAAGIQAVFDRTLEAFGGLDILINNVGLGRGTHILETTDEEWLEAFDQTLFPAVRASRQAVPHLRRRGGGSIVMVA